MRKYKLLKWPPESLLLKLIYLRINTEEDLAKGMHERGMKRPQLRWLGLGRDKKISHIQEMHK